MGQEEMLCDSQASMAKYMRRVLLHLLVDQTHKVLVYLQEAQTAVHVANARVICNIMDVWAPLPLLHSLPEHVCLSGSGPSFRHTATTLCAIGMSVPVHDLMHLPPVTLDVAVPCCMAATRINMRGGVSDNMCAQHAGDRYISYLPLAHIYERVVMTSVTYRAMSVGFYR